ncbi:MAG: hypothetical protein JNJ55_11000 [Betaproteobacteria bacterium]|nr:hypothetical protein [Betaproteobacteria bacterium]
MLTPNFHRGGRLLFDAAGFPLDVVPQADRKLKRLAAGVLLSILAHAVFLWLAPAAKFDPSDPAPSSLDVSLLPPSKTPPPMAAPVEPQPQSRAPMIPRRTLTAPSQTAKTFAVPEEPPDPPPKEARAPAPDDFASVLEARRAQRQEQEAAAAAINAQYRAGDPNAAGADRGAENARRNLAALGRGQGGTGGVFSILDMSHRRAQYAFNGWMPTRTNGWREVIEVEAGPDGDVKRAIIRSMITLIRKHYQGNFNWESHRLGRVIVLSARLEDNQGLEEFMMREFF